MARSLFVKVLVQVSSHEPIAKIIVAYSKDFGGELDASSIFIFADEVNVTSVRRR